MKCRVCKTTDPARFGSKSSICKLCDATRAKAWRDKNKDRLNAALRERYANDAEWRESRAKFTEAWRLAHPEVLRKNTLKRLYGATDEEAEALIAQEAKGCTICGTKARSKRHPRAYLDVDHCHETGRIRGLLCGACNLGLGQFLHEPDLLIRAAAYLEAA